MSDPILGCRSVSFGKGVLTLIDQRKLPGELVFLPCHTVEEVFSAIKEMAVRGAPAIGAAGAFGVAIASRGAADSGAAGVLDATRAAKAHLDEARPTAVNLSWATKRLVEFAEALLEAHSELSGAQLADALEREAQAIADEDVDINRRLGEHGARLVPAGSNVLHHCNTGALATVDIGTALGVIYTCHRQGKGIHVWVDETRPRLQGARLTAWELHKAGVPMHLIADNAAGHLMRVGKVQVVVFGADRVARNGDVANKVGTYKLAVCAKESGIPVYACVPTSTIDLSLAHGDEIVIEERSAEEVTTVGGVRVAPDVPVFNPAFDVTPYRYLTGIVTEEGVCYPPYEESLAAAVARAQERVSTAWKAKLASLKSHTES